MCFTRRKTYFLIGNFVQNIWYVNFLLINILNHISHFLTGTVSDENKYDKVSGLRDEQQIWEPNI